MDKQLPFLKNPYFQLHLSVFLFGFTAILGASADLSSFWLVWHRCWLAIIGFAVIGIIRNGASFFFFRNPVRLIFIGGILALHWLLFFLSIRLSSASITLACLGTGTLFTALLEPIFLPERKLHWVEILVSGIVLAGLLLIYQAEAEFSLGILVALLSTLLSSLYSILNKKYITHLDTVYVNFMELWGSFGVVSLCIPILFWLNEPLELFPSQQDWGLLLILAWLCTCFAYILSINALKKVSAFTYILSVNMEPVYGILMAWILLGEKDVVHLSFILGTTLILSSVIVYPWLKTKITASLK